MRSNEVSTEMRDALRRLRFLLCCSVGLALGMLLLCLLALLFISWATDATAKQLPLMLVAPGACLLLASGAVLFLAIRSTAWHSAYRSAADVLRILTILSVLATAACAILFIPRAALQTVLLTLLCLQVPVAQFFLSRHLRRATAGIGEEQP
ncbi:hypothetical protein [Actinobaculum sp. 352]|uniref:hypothetical protein n=1 Tax=Actinobaculum sp. 352 TaxID=2490946 RepID=UPI000F7EFF40|nr:hypothetical protein [Actinobaculum sp. 352]RTE48962.1 hypothetical protein EKN07_07445 [Actinobaculum sp. 352]